MSVVVVVVVGNIEFSVVVVVGVVVVEGILTK